MILIGVGGNLPSTLGGPLVTCQAALAHLERGGAKVEAVSSWYETAPVPASDQPWFVNAVAHVTTALAPGELLKLMHTVESDLGRIRTVRNAARVVDLDLLAYGDLVNPGPEAPLLPHPRLQDRAFVLFPLRDVAPHWRHPVLGLDIADLIARLPPAQDIRPLKS
jgi:2-amino-4-hydroxy-6-hydroxymethyldihydropteridine diphosphokinase